jgi:phage antirepressor YoqD-like protein
MNELAKRDGGPTGEITIGGRVTLEDIALITGAAYSTVAAYAQKAGWTENGKRTLLDEQQATVIIEAMKRGNGNQHDLPSSLEGIETTKSRALRIDFLHRQIEAEMRAEIEALEKKAAEDAPKVAAWQKCLDSDSCLDFMEAAAVLNIKGLGRNTLLSLLRGYGVLNNRNRPYRPFIDNGCFRVIETAGVDPDGKYRIHTKTLVHQKGIEFILRLLSARKNSDHITPGAYVEEALF